MKKVMVIMAIAAAVCGCVANKLRPKGIDSLTAEISASSHLKMI